MPAINKIRLTNIVYEEGNKRYNDELFLFNGYNGAILLENGGGKTVFIQTVLQGMIPHTDLADRKIKNTLVLENAPAHIAIEWILNERPRRYVVTAVTLFMTDKGLDSYRYVYEYDEGDQNGIEGIPFVREGQGGTRPADKGEMLDYYNGMKERYPLSARTFSTIKEYRKFIEEQYHIIADEWESIVTINSSEGGVEAFFEACKNTTQLFDRLLIPTVEQSIAGHHPTLFADIFEKQLDNLKLYKKLKETIEENKRIQHQLEKYVQTFEKLHSSQLAYDKSKQKAKGIWEEIQIQKIDVAKEMEKNKEQFNLWIQKKKEHEVKVASYQIAVEEEKYEQLQKDYDLANVEYGTKKEELEQHSLAYYSLKFAKCKQLLNHYQKEIAFVESEMKKLEEIEELSDLQNQLEETKQALLGHFIKQMDDMKKNMEQIQFELNPIVRQIDTLQEEKRSIEKHDLDKQREIAGVQKTIQMREADIERLKQTLLSNPQHEQVEEKMAEWQNRHQFLDEELIRLHGEKKEKEKQSIELDETIEKLKNEKNGLHVAKEQLKNEKSQIENEQRKLIRILGRLRPQWAILESVYENEHSIYNRLYETIEKLKKEKEVLLYKERVALRLVDDYGEQKTFFSDPLIEARIKSWKNQLDYCVTGIEYLQMLNEADYEEKVFYPLWAVTLITTNKSKEELQKKVEDLADELRYPIQILTTEEAAKIKKDAVQPEPSWIIPAHWEKGMMEETFGQWKEKVRVDAEKATKERELKETEQKEWEYALQAFQQFLKDYPYERLTDFQKRWSETMLKIEQIEREIENAEQQRKNLKHQITTIGEQMELCQEEMQGLERKIQEGNQYFHYCREVKEAKEVEKELKDVLANIKAKKAHLAAQLLDYNEQKAALEERKQNLKWKLDSLKNDEEYKEVQSLTPIFTGESRKNLRDKIQTLNLKIHQASKSIGELNEKLANAKHNLTKLQEEMDQIRNECENVHEHWEFPSDGEHLLQNKIIKIKELKQALNKLEKQVTEKLSAKEEQKGKRNHLKQLFRENFPNHDIYTFSVPLNQAEEELAEEKKALQKEKNYLDEQMEQVSREQNKIDEAERELIKFIEKHHFNAPQVVTIPLSENEKMDFIYNRKKMVKAIIQELEQHSGQVEKEKEAVDAQKQAYKQFCSTISDNKLQKMAIEGVDYKTGYEELLDFKKNMMIRIERSTNYANEHIRQKDEELQAYINQIHNHLKTVVEELKQIPKHTKVKEEDQWKTIYTFTIPQWDEEEGKQRIRDYIEWIMLQLESDRYVKENGLQDETKVRNDIEMWMQTKQLLQVVMKNEGMKVSCRKVTNENKVSTRSYSWEQSNVWSGGEKWSKNMTLFLGLLKYVAEKKQHQKTNMKHSRVVILDNPFGKASSDHVLSPVFFVAEQLGFQIIALTAHAEGKFLRDYFPVIYSCKLREAKQANKQIVTTEKWLHHAYFRDHEPEALERLTEKEQMSLF
jgi:hypothetical protein